MGLFPDNVTITFGLPFCKQVGCKACMFLKPSPSGKGYVCEFFKGLKDADWQKMFEMFGKMAAEVRGGKGND